MTCHVRRNVTLRRIHATTGAVEKQYYYECVRVALVIHFYFIISHADVYLD